MENTPPKKSGLFISVRMKLLVGFTLIFSLVFAAAFYWFYTFATETAMTRITDDLVGTIKGATETGILEASDDTQIINGDELEALIKEGVRREDGHSDDPRYWHQVEVLCEIRRIEPRASVYTYYMGEQPGEIIFVTSWSACMSDNPYGAEFKLSWVTENPAPNEAGLRAITLQEEAPNFCTYGDPGCEPVAYTDDYGTWVSAFAPIRNSKGQAVAALGVDFEASYVKQVQQGILESIYVAFGLTYAVLFLLVYLVSNFVSRPMTVLTKAADKIGEAQYEEGLGTLKEVKTSDRFPDEIHTLKDVFEAMVGKVYQREENLRRTVEELRIEIDEVKRSKAVGEIVDTEFFQELSTKADKMRSQRRARFAKKDSEA